MKSVQKLSQWQWDAVNIIWLLYQEKQKCPRLGVRIVFQHSYKTFDADLFVNDVKDLNWSDVCQENDATIALKIFMDTFVRLKKKVCEGKKCIVD